ncbi:MAG: hypothetical protein ABSF29_03940 [Tepidisphaeraceae bacterium]|jgi:3-oxoacyl-(acyl-carrier-protein) synthase
MDVFYQERAKIVATLENPDPQRDLNFIPGHARATNAQIALCNCIAFGSKNSEIVLRVNPLD